MNSNSTTNEGPSTESEFAALLLNMIYDSPQEGQVEVISTYAEDTGSKGLIVRMTNGTEFKVQIEATR